MYFVSLRIYQKYTVNKCLQNVPGPLVFWSRGGRLNLITSKSWDIWNSFSDYAIVDLAYTVYIWYQSLSYLASMLLLDRSDLIMYSKNVVQSFPILWHNQGWYDMMTSYSPKQQQDNLGKTIWNLISILSILGLTMIAFSIVSKHHSSDEWGQEYQETISRAHPFLGFFPVLDERNAHN